MQTEQDWIGRLDEDEHNGAAERYQYFMRPEPREDLGPIEEIDDPYFGPGCKVRKMRVGMIRNAKDENKKDVLVYLRPFPHIRIEKAKNLQGWYQSLHNKSKQSRPRPCFTEAILTEPYGGYCAVGCAFCLDGDSLVHTKSGLVKIKEIQPGFKVLGRETYGMVETTVLKTSERVVSEIYEIRLNNGQLLRATAEHPFFINGSRKQVKELQVGDKIEAFQDEEAMPNLWESSTLGQKDMLSKLLSGPSQSSWKERRQQKQRQGANRRSKKETQRGNQRTSQIKRNQETYERACDEKSREYGSSSLRSQEFGMESGSSRESKSRDQWVQNVSPQTLQDKEREIDHLSVGVGVADSPMVGRSGSNLELRAEGVSHWVRSLPSRLLGSGMESVYRSERVLSKRATGEDGSVSREVPDRGMDCKRVGKPGHTITSIQKVKGKRVVYDIQTTSENFYVDGVLSSNCYINSGIKGYRGTGLITVPLDYGDQIKKQLSKMHRSAAGYFSSFTDPFTPLEQWYHNTENAARAFVDQGLPIFFLSRLPYPEWAIDMLKQNPHSYAQKSINTPDPDDWRLLSPGALPLEGHLDEINKLHRQGIYVSIQVNPVVPGITTHGQVVELFHKLKKAGADHVIVKFVEAAYSWAPTMVEKMKKRFGEERGGEFEKLFTQNIGCERTIEEDYRMRGHRIYSATAKKLGLTYATCYEYKYERDEKGKILSKTGISVGREFTTAAQCHGHRVPMYRRVSDERFEPLEECPPSGCLYCASENDGEPRCGDELAGEGKALRLVDLKVPFHLQGKQNAAS